MILNIVLWLGVAMFLFNQMWRLMEHVRARRIRRQIDAPPASPLIDAETLFEAAVKVETRGEIDSSSLAPECSGLDIDETAIVEFAAGLALHTEMSGEQAQAAAFGVLWGLQTAKDREAA